MRSVATDSSGHCSDNTNVSRTLPDLRCSRPDKGGKITSGGIVTIAIPPIQLVLSCTNDDCATGTTCPYLTGAAVLCQKKRPAQRLKTTLSRSIPMIQ